MRLRLEAGRGSPLWRAPLPGVAVHFLRGDLSGMVGILDDHFYQHWPFKSCAVSPGAAFMLINLGPASVTFELSPDLANEVPIYDPYLYEQSPPPDVDPGIFRQEQTSLEIPDGFIDTLAKWYSVKYTYPEYNLICIRPGLGTSFQTHTRRGEHWEVITGSPILVVGSVVTYNATPGVELDLPRGILHCIINPSEDV